MNKKIKNKTGSVALMSAISIAIRSVLIRYRGERPLTVTV